MSIQKRLYLIVISLHFRIRLGGFITKTRKKGWHDREFCEKRTIGFKALCESVANLDIDIACRRAGVSREELAKIAALVHNKKTIFTISFLDYKLSDYQPNVSGSRYGLVRGNVFVKLFELIPEICMQIPCTTSAVTFQDLNRLA